MVDMRFDRYKGLSIDKSTGLSTPVQIVISKSQYMRHIQTLYAPYHRYKGLSSIPNLARYTEDILDTKHSIYKHYVPDMGIWRYEGLADMKV